MGRERGREGEGEEAGDNRPRSPPKKKKGVQCTHSAVLSRGKYLRKNVRLRKRRLASPPPLPLPLASPLKNDMSTGLGEGGKGGVPSSSVDDPFFHIPTSVCPRFSSIFSPGWMGETGKWVFFLPPSLLAQTFQLMPPPLFPLLSLLSFIHYPCSPSLPLGYTAAPPFLHSKPIPPLIFFPGSNFPSLVLGGNRQLPCKLAPFFPCLEYLW